MEDTAADERLPSNLDIVQRLQAENAALKAEIQALRSNTERQASQADPHDGQTFNFLGLPRELRNPIYELCVVVGDVRPGPVVLEPFEMQFLRPRDGPAEMSLFEVNKQVRREALEPYLMKNHFLVSTMDMSAYNEGKIFPFSYIPGYDEDPDNNVYLRSISMSLDSRDNIQDKFDGTKEFIDFHLDVDHPEEVKSVLDHHNTVATGIYEAFVATLVGVFEYGWQLHRIQINMQNTACGYRCHRLVVALFSDKAVRDKLEEFVNDYHQIESLDFLGTLNNKERHAIRTAFPQVLLNKITFHGQWNSSQETWDPDVEVFDETPNELDSVEKVIQEVLEMTE